MIPSWKADLDTMISAGTSAAKKNPGTANVFNGRHWVPVEKALPEFKKLSTVSEQMASALREAAHTLLAANLAHTLAYRQVSDALLAYDEGKEV